MVRLKYCWQSCFLRNEKINCRHVWSVWITGHLHVYGSSMCCGYRNPHGIGQKTIAHWGPGKIATIAQTAFSHSKISCIIWSDAWASIQMLICIVLQNAECISTTSGNGYEILIPTSVWMLLNWIGKGFSFFVIRNHLLFWKSLHYIALIKG